MYSSLPYTERVMSGFPLSIGTALAFETLFEPTQEPFDKERKAPPKFDLVNYQSCYVNLDTLFRNLVAALDKTQYANSDPERYVATLEEEIDVINGLFQDHAGYCLPIFYQADYAALKRKMAAFPAGMSGYREPHTEAQKVYELLRNKTMEKLHKRSDKFVLFHKHVEPDRYESSVILTHAPYDLTGFRKFNDLQLLESHTGLVKPRQEWYTKFHKHPRNDLALIPFCEKTLLFFGDRIMISPVGIAARDAVLEVAKRHNWTAFTTEEKMQLDISISINDPGIIAGWRLL